MHTFFINAVNQLYCLQHVLSDQVFIIWKTVQAALRYLIMHLYKQSGRYYDVFDIKAACTVFLMMNT
jgi:hypothetical protein